ncbi:MAG: hypothetical protein EKK53_26710 [Burkholderiales bacterium]|nr:MAG: hypothetical protein EKK53_26710 [Burkholderiales bacterium]
MAGPFSKHPYDSFLDELDRVQQKERVRELERLQAQALREAERLGGVRMREQFVDSRFHPNGQPRITPSQAELEYMQQLLYHNQRYEKPAQAAQPAPAAKPKPLPNRKLLLL